MRRKWITIVIGALLVLGSAYGFTRYMKSYELDVTTMETLKPVKMIQAGELITPSMIRKVSIPAVQHIENGIRDPQMIIGKRAIVPIGEMEEFLSWKIGADDLYPKQDEQYFGFTVDFVSSVNNMIRRGDKVSAWVEYTQPKVLDESGREIDSTQQSALLSANPNLQFKKVYVQRLLDTLTVAYVKDQEGKEITDGRSNGPISIPGSSAQHDEDNAERYRQNASGQPMYITFIMSSEEYEAFATGAREGTIRLGLPGSSVVIGTINSSSKAQASPPDNDTASDEPSAESGIVNIPETKSNTDQSVSER